MKFIDWLLGRRLPEATVHDGGTGVLCVGDVVALPTRGAPSGKSWHPADVHAFLTMCQPPEQVEKQLRELIAQNRLFLEIDGAHAVVLKLQSIYVDAALVRITVGLNPGREAWCSVDELVRVTKR